MAWSDPSTHVAGYLVTADDWNEIVNNLKHLRGQDGTTVLEGDVDPNADLTQNFGSFSKRWGQHWTSKLYTGNGMMVVHRGTVRQVTQTWESDDPVDQQVTIATTGGGDRNPGGPGQWVFSVRENAADTVYVSNKAEQNNAADTSWAASRNPYGCFPFYLDGNDSWLDLWIGFRQTLGAAVPVAAAEKYCGIHFDGTTWYSETADGTAETQNAQTALAAGQWHVIEILIISETSVIFAVDGTVVEIHTANLPTGDLDWQLLMISDGSGGGATTTYLTIGELLLQEALS